MKGIKVKLGIVAAMIFGTTAAFAADGIKVYKNSAEASYAREKYELATADDFKKPVITASLTLRTDEGSGLKWYGIKGVYALNKAAVNKYEAAVIFENKKVEKLKANLKQARKDKSKSDIPLLKRKLKKAKFDLFRDQVHLMVDREALRHDYKMVIDDQRKELASDRKELCKAKAEARRDKEGKGLAARRVDLKEREVNADKAAIANEKAMMKADMAQIDEVLK
jgi:hypothetical protein